MKGSNDLAFMMIKHGFNSTIGVATKLLKREWPRDIGDRWRQNLVKDVVTVVIVNTVKPLPLRAKLKILSQVNVSTHEMKTYIIMS